MSSAFADRPKRTGGAASEEDDAVPFATTRVLLRDEIDSLRGENASLRDDFEALRDDVHRVVKETLLLGRDRRREEAGDSDRSTTTTIDPPGAGDVEHGRRDAERIRRAHSDGEERARRTTPEDPPAENDRAATEGRAAAEPINAPESDDRNDDVLLSAIHEMTASPPRFGDDRRRDDVLLLADEPVWGVSTEWHNGSLSRDRPAESRSDSARALLLADGVRRNAPPERDTAPDAGCASGGITRATRMRRRGSLLARTTRRLLGLAGARRRGSGSTAGETRDDDESEGEDDGSVARSGFEVSTSAEEGEDDDNDDDDDNEDDASTSTAEGDAEALTADSAGGGWRIFRSVLFDFDGGRHEDSNEDGAASLEEGDDDDDAALADSRRDGDEADEFAKDEDVERFQRDDGKAKYDPTQRAFESAHDDNTGVASNVIASRRRSRRANKRMRWRRNRRAANKNRLGRGPADKSSGSSRSTNNVLGEDGRGCLTNIAPSLARGVAGRWKGSVARMALIGLTSVALLSMALGQRSTGTTADEGDLREGRRWRHALEEGGTSASVPSAGNQGDVLIEIPCLTLEDCERASLSLVPSVTSFHPGNWPAKGCYVKNGRAYFSPGTVAEMSEVEMAMAALERITCAYDSAQLEEARARAKMVIASTGAAAASANPTSTNAPTSSRSERPTTRPTEGPSSGPASVPTEGPSRRPTDVPTEGPSRRPTDVPTEGPSRRPTDAPLAAFEWPFPWLPEPSPATKRSSDSPSVGPSIGPSSVAPSGAPSGTSPSDAPSITYSGAPSGAPSGRPTSSHAPTSTVVPSSNPTITPAPVTRSPAYVCEPDPPNCGCPPLMNDYRGTTSVTRGGRTCQRWDVQVPHAHSHSPRGRGGHDARRRQGLEENYCRNPDDDPEGPWCYTTDASVRFDYCDVPVCGGQTLRPTSSPSVGPTRNPTEGPSRGPTDVPTEGPSTGPTDAPLRSFEWPPWLLEQLEQASLAKHSAAVDAPSAAPSSTVPSGMPSDTPPSGAPSGTLSDAPSETPSDRPTNAPSASAMPTVICPKRNEEACGCADARQADYRGSMDYTERGVTCENWNADWIVASLGFEPKVEFPRAGLLNEKIPHNHCRNPTGDEGGAYCLTKASFWPGAPATTAVGVARSGGDITGAMAAAAIERCDVPVCDPCGCVPPCGRPNPHPCGCPSAFQAEECCLDPRGDGGREDEIKLEGLEDWPGGADEGASCRCSYYREACRRSLEQNETHFCADAEAACCGGGEEEEEDPRRRRGCECNLYEKMCIEHPHPHTCRRAAESCCGRGTPEAAGEARCLCDFRSFAAGLLGSGTSGPRNDTCEGAAEQNNVTLSSKSDERAALEGLFVATGGEGWLDRTGWLNDRVDHCIWHGVRCDEHDAVVEIDLGGNGLVSDDGDDGAAPLSDALASFPSLRRLDLSRNKLGGASPEFGGLRELVSVDVSRNRFEGHAEMVFGPATVRADYSRNRLTSVGFRRFSAAYETMSVVDLSHNNINQSAAEVFRNVPSGVTELRLSDNMIRGAFPNPLPILRNLTRLDLSGNGMEGAIPASVAERLPELEELNLAKNGLRGSVPPEVGRLERLVAFNVSANKLEGDIPGSLGRLAGVLELLDLSDNRLSGRIPAVIGRLGEAIVLLGGNRLTPPAPLSVCKLDSMKEDEDLCPMEIKILEEIYHNFNGPEWINNEYWLDESESYCAWHGVVCDAEMESSTVMLELQNNGLSGNLTGFIMELMSGLNSLEVLDFDGNDIGGSIPTEIALLDGLVKLDLSNQKHGLVGTIPDEISTMNYLEHLGLGGNKLGESISSRFGGFGIHFGLGGDKSGESIPSRFGILPHLKYLNLSSNLLGGSIPRELRRLEDTIETLDLSNNKLRHRIPSELGELHAETIVHLSGNADLSDPAPLDLCSRAGFDLSSDQKFCPAERGVLKEIYESAKGREWTKSYNWLDAYIPHCLWYGVDCDKNNNTIKLELPSNGMSGTLSPSVANLSMLEVVDLSDNDIKGAIPTEIGLLSNVNHIRLAYNLFVGNETNFGTSLKKLELLQLHGNRLSGAIPSLDLQFEGRSSFVADCGNPSEFDESLICEDCTMCCNAQGDCYPKEDTLIQELGFHDYVEFTWVFFACVFGISGALAFISRVYDKYLNRNVSRTFIRQLRLLDKDTKYALDMIGEDSVYQFFLGNSLIGWIICLCTIVAQMWMLFLFVKGAEIDLSDDNTDLVYTWRCSRDQAECSDTGDLTWEGWVAFAILMVAHLFKDVINGSRMVVLSGKERTGGRTRIKYFFGGTLLGTVSLFTFYVSTLYNAAIATSNTEIVMNSVVILFICDVDELFFDILMVINSAWVESLCYHRNEDGHAEQNDLEQTFCATAARQDKADEAGPEKPEEATHSQRLEVQISGPGRNRNLEEVVKGLDRQIRTLHESMNMVMDQNAELKRLIAGQENLSLC